MFVPETELWSHLWCLQVVEWRGGGGARRVAGEAQPLPWESKTHRISRMKRTSSYLCVEACPTMRWQRGSGARAWAGTPGKPYESFKKDRPNTLLCALRGAATVEEIEENWEEFGDAPPSQHQRASSPSYMSSVS